jgi:twinkle protein
MPTMADKLAEHGIRPKRLSEGTEKLLCPKCSHTPRNKSDPCLSLLIDEDGATWHCHNCGWKGGVSDREPVERKAKVTTRPAKPKHKDLGVTPELLDWFAKRGISADVVRRNKITMTRA